MDILNDLMNIDIKASDGTSSKDIIVAYLDALQKETEMSIKYNQVRQEQYDILLKRIELDKKVENARNEEAQLQEKYTQIRAAEIAERFAKLSEKTLNSYNDVKNILAKIDAWITVEENK